MKEVKSQTKITFTQLDTIRIKIQSTVSIIVYRFVVCLTYVQIIVCTCFHVYEMKQLNESLQ